MSKDKVSVLGVHNKLMAGYPLAELHRSGHLRMAPGITLAQYLETLRAFGKVVEVDGVLRYRSEERE